MGQLLKAATWLQGGMLKCSFDRATKDPEAAQAGLLADIIKNNQASQYGMAHGFPAITNPSKFAEAVPISTFVDLSPYVERMKKGESGILTRGRPVLFNVTSGTTDKPKYVPVTKKGMARIAATTHQWLYRALRDHPEFLDKAILCISGSSIEGRTEAGIPYGSASGRMYESLPRVLHRSFVLPFVLSEIRDYDLRYYVMARLALEAEVSFVVTPNPTTLIKLAETGIQHQEEIVRSIRDGVLFKAWSGPKSPEDSRILDLIAARFSRNPLRAGYLEQVIQRHGRLLPFACWKDLKLIGCWLGGSIGFQAEKLAAYYGNAVPRRDIGYLSSEGSITIPSEDNTPAGILALNNNYYEFIPADSGASGATRVMQCHELEMGGQYKIILTSCSGLYRYDIHDIVEVRGYYNRTPVIAFVRKGDDMLNITGEKLHINHFLEAFGKMKQVHAVSVTQFRIIPNYSELRYELMIHFGSAVAPEFLRDIILPQIDKSLCDSNIEYDSKRKSKRINPPCIHLMDDLWTDDANRCFMKSGYRDVQYKWRTIVNQMSDVDARHIKNTITIQGGSNA